MGTNGANTGEGSMMAAQAALLKSNRIDEVRNTMRVEGGGPPEGNNGTAGLIELVEHARPRTVLEIGSHAGVSTEVFLLYCERVVSVDPWPGEVSELAFAACKERCCPYPGYEFIRGCSPEALDRFAPGEFDLVYIDAMHDYRRVVDDIRAARRISSKWLAGHDYCIPDVAAAVLTELGRPERIFSDDSWLIRVD